jgi:hypothetical protein
MDDRRMLLLSILYRFVRCLLGLTTVLMRRDLSKDAASCWCCGTRMPCCAAR